MQDYKILGDQELARHVRVPADCPDIILLVGPCRSGTTATQRAIAQSGVPTIYQPLKAVLKGIHDGDNDALFTIPEGSNKLLIKETLGPYTTEESTMNPVEILLRAGVPPKKITLLTMEKEPLATVTSWFDKFSKRAHELGITTDTLVDNAIAAYTTTNEIRVQAQDKGIKTVAFTYEALRDNKSEVVLQNLFDKLDIPLSSEVFTDWRDLPPMGTPESGMAVPPNSEKHYTIKQTSPMHNSLEGSSGFIYVSRASDTIDRTLGTHGDNTVRKLEASGVFSLYNQHRRDSTNDLRLGIGPSIELAEFHARHGRGFKEGRR